MSDDSSTLNDEMLLEICQVSPKDLDATPALADELRLARRLVPPPRACHDGRLEHAMTLLTSALGQMSKHNPVHLPFGYGGPTITSSGWINRDDLELVAKQIVGLTWTDSKPDNVNSIVGQAISNAVSLGLIQQQEYDAWRPGMASGSGWRSAVAATAYGVAKARSLGKQQEDMAMKPACANDAGERSLPTKPADSAMSSVGGGRSASDRAPFDLPELDQYRRLDPLDFATVIERWEIAVEKLAEALIEGDAERVGVIAGECSLEQVSNLVRLAMEDRGISCDAIIRLCELFGRVASGFEVQIKDGWLDEAMASTERLKTRLALELDTNRPLPTRPEQTHQDSNGQASSAPASGSKVMEHLQSAKRLLESLPDIDPDDATGAELAYAENATIEYLRGRFGYEDEPPDWPRDWYECPEAWEFYMRKIMEYRAGAATALVAAAEESAATEPTGDREPQPRREDDLSQLLDGANSCLMALEDMRRDYSTMAAVSSRMEGGGEDWNFADRRDEANYRDAQQRIKSNMRFLPEQLAEILDWGLQRGMEIFENLDLLTNDSISSGVKADICRDYELGVRAVMNAIIVEQTRGQMIGVGSGGDPAADVGNWVFEDLPDGEVRARNRRLCERYAALNSEDLLLLCHQWHQMAIGFTVATKRAGRYHGNVIHDEKVQEVTKILETAIVSRQMGGASRLSRCLRRPDDGHLRPALATLDVLEARLRVETCESGTLKVARGAEDETKDPDSRPQAPKTTVVKAPSKECYGELDVRSADNGFLRLLFIKNTAGRPTSVCQPIPVEGQLLAILVAGRDMVTRKLREAVAELPAGGLPEDYKTVLEWTQDSIQDHVRGAAAAGRQAINRLRHLVTFQNGSGLVTNQDATGTWRSTVPFRLRTSGKL